MSSNHKYNTPSHEGSHAGHYSTPISPATPEIRKDEALELGDLNKRLEMYVERHKQHDMERNILEKKMLELKATIRQNAEQEIGNLTAMHESQLADIRKNRDEISAANVRLTATVTKLEEQKSRQAKMLDKIKDALSEKKKKCDALAMNNEHLHHKLETEMFLKKQEIEKLTSDLTTSNGDLAALRDEIALVKEKLEHEVDLRMSLETRWKVLKEDKELQKIEWQQQIAKKTTEIKKMEDILGTTGLNELDDMLSAMQARHEEEKTRLLQELELRYNGQSAEQRQTIVTLQQQLANVQTENQRLILENEKLFPKARTHGSLEDECKALNVRCGEYEKKNIVFKQTVAILESKFNEERIARLASEEKFQGLYHINVNLKAAIKRYDNILSNGEQDYTLGSQKKKRKCHEGHVHQPTFEDTTDSMELEGVRIHFEFDEEELNKSHQVQGDIKIVNYDSVAVNLQNWCIRSKETGARFNFPNNAVLPPKEERSILIGKNNTDKLPDYHWDEEGVFSGDVGEAELVDASGTVVWNEKFAVTFDQDQD